MTIIHRSGSYENLSLIRNQNLYITNLVKINIKSYTVKIRCKEIDEILIRMLGNLILYPFK